MEEEEKSDEWKCFRCKAILPSPDGSGRPPVSCPESAGGCGRSVDGDEEGRDVTSFYPAAWSDGKADLHYAVDRPGEILFRKIVGELERLIEFGHPWNSRMCALYIFQSYFFRALYPHVFYLAFQSPLHGAGKSTATRIITGLCKDGFMVGGLTAPYLERKMDLGGTPGVDELDALSSDLRGVVEKSLRYGYERGAVSGKVDEDEKGRKKPREFSIFCPKAFNFRSRPEEALMARAYPIQMARVRDDVKVDRVGDNEVYILKPNLLQTEIREFASARLSEWSLDRVITTLENPEFRGRVSELTGMTGTPRDVQLAYMCLLTAEVVGIDIRAEVRDAFGASSDYQVDEEMSELVNLVKEAWESAGRPPFMLNSELRKAINAVKVAAKDPPMSPKWFPRAMERIGLRIGTDLKRVPHDGRPAVYFTDQALKILASEGEVRSVFAFTDPSPDPQNGEVGEVTSIHPVKDTSALVTLLRRKGESKIRESRGEGFTVADMTSPDDPPDLTPKFIESTIKKWLESGIIYCPKTEGVYKFA